MTTKSLAASSLLAFFATACLVPGDGEDTSVLDDRSSQGLSAQNQAPAQAEASQETPQAALDQDDLAEDQSRALVQGAAVGELHIVGIYEARNDHRGGYHPEGETTVRVEPSASGDPITLVLSSYEPVHWKLDVAPGAELVSVILNGYHDSRVSGQGMATVDEFTFKGTGAYLAGAVSVFQWEPEIDPYGDWANLPDAFRAGLEEDARENSGLHFSDAIESIVGLELTTYQGCYRGTEFAISPDVSTSRTDLYSCEGSEYSLFPLSGGSPTPSALVCEAGDPSLYEPAPAQRGNLHIVSVYEARNDHRGGSHPEGEIMVDIEPSASGDPITLVLSSYEPVHWKLDVAPGAELASVILNGYHDSRVSGQGMATVDEFTFKGTGTFLSAYPYQWEPEIDPHGDWANFPEALRVELERNAVVNSGTYLSSQVSALTGDSLGSYQGCYREVSFTVTP